MWDAFGDFACTKAPAAARSLDKAAVPGFSPAGAFGSDGAAVTFETFQEEQNNFRDGFVSSSTSSSCGCDK
jgi:hypothetical protein